jgi:hypothetical protein
MENWRFITKGEVEWSIPILFILLIIAILGLIAFYVDG